MKEAFKAVKVTDDVYWVGAIDWSVRDFHGYLTSKGTTYNAFLVLADKVTLIDTAKAEFAGEVLARIASVIDPGRIDYIVSNHSEPDHTGCLRAVIDTVKPEKVFASRMGVKALAAHYRLEGVTQVTDGEELSLGNKTLTFFDTQMCHWPDSMVSYLHEDELLFSQDAFGMHLASYERFDDELEQSVMDCESAKYYANILMPFAKSIKKTLGKLTDSHLPVSLIAPDHGPIWRKNPSRILNDYACWAQQARTNKAVVLYDTMWESTELMARAIGEGLWAGGARTKLIPVRGVHRSDVATELLDAGALVIGAPTINGQLYPSLGDVLSYVRGLKPAGLIGAAFGSFGWSGEATKQIAEFFEHVQIEQVTEPLKVKYVPTDEDLRLCYEMGSKIASRLIEKIQAG